MRNKEINNNGLSDYFNFQFCLNNKTLFKHIDEFPKASFAFFKNGKLIRKGKYWENKYEIDREHNEKWFNTWRTLDCCDCINNIKQHYIILEKRMDMVIKLLSIRKKD